MKVQRHRLLTLAVLAGSVSFGLAQTASAFSPFGTQFDFETDADSVLPPTTKQNTDTLHNQSYGGIVRPGDQTAGVQDFSTASGSRTEELAISAIIAEANDLDADNYYGPTAARDNSAHVAILFRGNEGTYDSVSYGPPNSSGRSHIRPSTDPFGYSVDLWLSPHIVPGGTTDNAGSPDWTSTPATNELDPGAAPRADNPGIQEFLWTNGVNNNTDTSAAGTYLTEVGVYVFVVDSNGAEPGNDPAWRFVSQVPSSPAPGAPPLEITLDADQWVTMEMTFDNSSDDNTILGTFRILNADHTQVLFEAVRDTNVSAANMGGLRYSWFTGIDYSIDHLFVDNWSSGMQLELQQVPEPASLALLAAGGLMMLRRRHVTR